MKHGSAGDLQALIEAELQGYGAEVGKAIKKEVRKAANECRKDLTATSPRGKGREHYADGWATQKTDETPNTVSYRVKNKTKPWLTHLLENGHAKANGGRVDAIPHIKPAEQRAAERLERAIKVQIGAID